MTLRTGNALTAGLATASAILLAGPSIFPTGTTIYHPDRAWNGYTVLSPLGTQAVIVIDMNGNIVKQWDGYNNSAGGPARVLPGGVVDGSGGRESPAPGIARAGAARFRRQRCSGVSTITSKSRSAKARPKKSDGLGLASAPRLAA